MTSGTAGPASQPWKNPEPALFELPGLQILVQSGSLGNLSEDGAKPRSGRVPAGARHPQRQASRRLRRNLHAPLQGKRSQMPEFSETLGERLGRSRRHTLTWEKSCTR